jgi:hypothetical protein
VIFLGIYANYAGFRAPPLIEGCGLYFEGTGRMWKGARMIGETRDEGDPAGASWMVSKRRHLPRILFRKRPTHVLQLQMLSKAVET